MEHRGIEAFSECKRVIVIAAHADDLETICGGTMRQLADQGVRIFSVNCTNGDLGTTDKSADRRSLAAERRKEAAVAAAILGLTQTFTLNHPDGELVADLQLRAEIAQLYRMTQADTLVTFDPFWSGQIHPDHRAAGQVALDAYMPSKMPLYHPEHLISPEVDVGQLQKVFLFSTDREPDIFIDVSACYDKKIAAASAHKSQFPRGEADLEWMKILDSAPGKIIGTKFAEAFKEIRVW